MCAATRKRGIDCGQETTWCQGLMLDDEDEVDQIPDPSIGTDAKAGVRVKLLSPVLFGRKRRDGDRGNTSESEPIFTGDFVQRFQDLVTDAEIDMESNEGATVETHINRKPCAALRRLD